MRYLSSILLLVYLLGPHAAGAQVEQRQAGRPTRERHVDENFMRLGNAPQNPYVPRSDHLEVFQAVKRGVAKGDPSAFSRYLGDQVSLSLRGGETGYFSGSQSFYLLSSFFSIHHPLGFDFTTFGESGDNPYATGGGTFVKRGVRERVQIYVSLSSSGSRWVISQFNIY